MYRKKDTNKRQKIDELDNYRIVRRTNMDTYRRRLQTFQANQLTNDSDQPSQQRFKRRHQSSSPNAPTQINFSSNPGSTLASTHKQTNLNVIPNKLFGVRIPFFHTR